MKKETAVALSCLVIDFRADYYTIRTELAPRVLCTVGEFCYEFGIEPSGFVNRE